MNILKFRTFYHANHVARLQVFPLDYFKNTSSTTNLIGVGK